MGAIGASDRDAELRARVCDAALACVGRWGLSKTTLEDVAREAGCGRATVYRAFHGGKAEVMAATLGRELDRFRLEVGAAIEAADPDLEERVVAGVVAATRFLRDHAALGYLRAREPDLLLPWVSFGRIGVLYRAVGDFAAPHLRAFVPDPEAAERTAEWLARVVLSYLVNPAEGRDLADPESARQLLSTYVIPGLVRVGRSVTTEETCPAPTPT
jgi:AcrR family transcriptional regulator